MLLALSHFGILRHKIRTPAFSQGIYAGVVILAVTLNSAGCGGGSISLANAESTPKIVTPRGTSTLTITPLVTTAAGKQLPALPPIQLTLIVN
jgi:hypothetical protein